VTHPAARSLTTTRRLRAELLRLGARLVFGLPPLRSFLGRSRAAHTSEGLTVDEDIAVVLDLDDRKGDTSIRGKSGPVARAQFAEGIASIEAAPLANVATRDLTYPAPAGPERARLYTPACLAAGSPGILYVHGGGFMTCDLDTHEVFCQRLALGAQARVVSIEYRLAPEHPWPAAIDDVLAAYRWLVAAAPALEIDAHRVAVAGESAGGHLSALLAQALRGDAHAPVLQALIYPAVDSTCSLPSHRELGEGWLLTTDMMQVFYDAYFANHPEERGSPRGSPLFAASVSGTAPALVYTAGFDPLKDEGLAYAERLRREGVAVRHHRFGRMIHGFITMTGVAPAARVACERMAADIGEALRVGVRP
jgi:acetyl esterase